jgi:hypothetical protein
MSLANQANLGGPNRFTHGTLKRFSWVFPAMPFAGLWRVTGALWIARYPAPRRYEYQRMLSALRCSVVY